MAGAQRTSFARRHPARTVTAFLILFLLYQSAEGIGQRLLGLMAVQAGLMIAMLIAAWPVGRFLLRGHGYRAYGLGWRRDVPILLGLGILIAFVGRAAGLWLGVVTHVYTVGPLAPGAGPHGAMIVAGLGLALVSTFVPSIAEDILTRGLWWRVGGPWLRGVRFVLISSLIYLLNHIYRLDRGPSEWVELFCFGLAYATAMSLTGTLWAAVGLHWGWNLANTLLDQYVAVEGVPGQAAWTSAVANLLMLVIVLALPLYRRRDESPVD